MEHHSCKKLVGVVCDFVNNRGTQDKEKLYLRNPTHK
ncbi:hypothetical protein Ahy_B10g101271 isoform L [Arachis hypogaea]|uniref:Uncharacterized protein n=1 Tax=Arachis hypogaea TaxID=3818 RepID=A0A444WZ12_ARAHY|nr:hypothetical protein Ahy_B10g101271 isoform L [Arachis hypogaea]